MPKIEKQALPVFLDENGNPVAAILYLQGKRVIFLLEEADEDQIIKLFEKEEKTIKSKTN